MVPPEPFSFTPFRPPESERDIAPVTPPPSVPSSEPDQEPEEDEAQEEYVDEEEEALSAGPTLAELHDELIATAAEARRGSRRTLDVLKQFGTMLDALAATVNDTHKAVRSLPATTASNAGGELPREWALALVEMADRMARVGDGLARPPVTAVPWWPGSRAALAAWREAWAVQADGFGILRSHLEALLKRAGLARIEVVGRPFDPTTMTAAESVPDAASPDHTVLAELLPGWHHVVTGNLVRTAQVRVSRRPVS